MALPRRSLCFGLWLVLVGCRPSFDVRIPLSLEAGDVVVYAELDESGRITSKGFAFSEPPRIQTGTEGLVPIWVLPRSQLLGPGGRPLEDAELERMEVLESSELSARADVGACGRCLVPGGGSPLVVHPGDRCEVPPMSFAGSYDIEGKRWVAAGEPGAVTGPRLSLAWPGACPCPARIPDAGIERLRSCALLPSEGPWPLSRKGTALTERGWLAAMGPIHVSVFDPEGREVEGTPPPALGKPLEFVLPLETSASTPPAFLTGVQSTADLRADHRLDLLRIEGQAIVRQAAILPTASLPDPQTALRIDDSRIWVGGSQLRGFNEEPALATLEWKDGALRVTEAVHPIAAGDCPFGRSSTRVISLARTSSGTGVALTSNGYFLFLPPDGGGWRCAGAFAIEETTRWPEDTPQFRGTVLTEGSRVFVCGSVGDEDGGLSALFSFDTAELAWDGTQLLSEPRLLSLVEPGSADCISIARRGSGAGARVVRRDGSLLDLDAEGKIELSYRSISEVPGFEAIGQEAWIYVSAGGGWEAVIGSSNSLYRRGPEIPLARLSGPENAVASRAPVIVPGPSPERALAFFGDRPPVELVDRGDGLGCERFSVEPRAVETGFQEGDVATSAVLLGGGGYRVFGRRADGASVFSRRYDEEAIRIVDEEDLPELEGDEILEARSLNEDTIIAITAQGRIASLAPSLVREVPISWDDPLTSSEERPRLRPGERPKLLALDVSEGVGWVTGSDLLVRILPDGQGSAVAQGFFRETAESESLREVPRFKEPESGEPAAPRFEALSAFCPDAVAVADVEEVVSGFTLNTTLDLHSWALLPEAECPMELATGPLALCPYPMFGGGGSSTNHDGDGVVGIVESPAGLHYVLRNGWVTALDKTFLLPFSIESARQAPRSTLLWVSGEEGRAGVAFPE